MKVFILLMMLLSVPSLSLARSDVATAVDNVDLDTSLLLPPPPAFDSILMANDRAQYELGLTLRKTPRGEQATRDANMKMTPALFSEAFGYQISQETTPEIYALLQLAHPYVDKKTTKAAKMKYMRVRPFVLYNTNTCYAEDEEKLRHTGSYPSGHSANAWGYALILAEINPARKDAIFERGFEMGQSRVICGYHWQSDVDAARVSSAAQVALLHADPAFQAQMEKAKKEFATLQKQKQK
ncbi:MAG: phosphatase PAP2 family protein [Desulfovibrio sp.]|nr:phosphatase PAP2 family protein [Desulfovibrio sp.]